MRPLSSVQAAQVACGPRHLPFASGPSAITSIAPKAMRLQKFIAWN